MKFAIGETVVIRSDLQAGMFYYNEDKSAHDTFSFFMDKFKGRKTKVIGYHANKYVLEIDQLHRYTDNMLISEAEADGSDVIRERSDRRTEFELDIMLGNILQMTPQQLIDDALDKGDKKRFEELCKFYKIGQERS